MSNNNNVPINPPKITHLGITRGDEWLIKAFPSELHAANWAAIGARDRYIWPVLQISLGPRMTVDIVPEKRVLVVDRADW